MGATTKTVLRELARQRAAIEKALSHGGAGDRLDTYLALAKPVIELDPRKATRRDGAPGASRLFGVPDLPEGMEWPSRDGVPFEHLGQLDLAALAPFDVEGKLPHQGLLSFFVGPDDDAFPDPHTCVLHIPLGDSLAPRPGPERPRKALGVDVALRLMLPPWASRLLESVNVQSGPYDDVSRELEEGFSHGMLCFDRPFEEWQAPGTEILLRLGDELPLPWDAVVLYVHITPADLAARRFDRAAAHAGPAV
jgi:hypothetical protein